MKITPFRKLVTLGEASAIVLEQTAAAKRTQKLKLEDCRGRVLSEDVSSPIDVPPFDRSAMDGYAVASRDIIGAGENAPVKLKIVGTLFAGDAHVVKVKKNTACRVATGAVIPDGADCVVMAEQAEEEGNFVWLRRAEPRWGNVSKKGSDMKKMNVVLSRGMVISPARAGVLASVGARDASFFIRPRIAIVSTGNEIAEPGTKLGRAQVYNSNSYTLSTLVGANGGEAVLLEKTQDTERGIREALDWARKEKCVVIAFSGGSSVGERDLLFKVISGQGKVYFHGVQIKPGKPFLFGRTRGMTVFGIPGYPAACLTVGYLFLAPCIRKMAHLPPEMQTVRARLSRRIASRLGRTQIMPVRLANGEAIPAFKESGAITSLAHADGYIVIPENTELVEKGETVEVVLY